MNERCYTQNCNSSSKLRYYTQTKLFHVNGPNPMKFGPNHQSSF